MGSVIVTFDFATDAQGFVATPGGPNTTLSYDSAIGNPAGSLKSRVVGKNINEQFVNDWRLETTFEGLGVPAGSTITGITSASMQSKCTEFNHGAHSTRGPAAIGSGVIFFNAWLSAEQTFRGIDADWVTSPGTDVTGLSLPSNLLVSIDIQNRLDTGASDSAAVSLNQDQLIFTILYD